MRKDMAELSIIAVEIGNSKHGNFLKKLAHAWHIADPSNKRLMEKFWASVCTKYNLYQEYELAIEKHIGDYEAGT